MSPVKARRARENSAYVRKLLSEREPGFAAALAAADRYISWSSRPGGDEDRDDPRCNDSGTVMLLLMAMLRESKRPLPARNVNIHLCPLREVGSI